MERVSHRRKITLNRKASEHPEKLNLMRNFCLTTVKLGVAVCFSLYSITRLESLENEILSNIKKPLFDSLDCIYYEILLS